MGNPDSNSAQQESASLTQPVIVPVVRELETGHNHKVEQSKPAKLNEVKRNEMDTNE